LKETVAFFAVTLDSGATLAEFVLQRDTKHITGHSKHKSNRRQRYAELLGGGSRIEQVGNVLPIIRRLLGKGVDEWNDCRGVVIHP
jgi:hypothetical protein